MVVDLLRWLARNLIFDLVRAVSRFLIDRWAAKIFDASNAPIPLPRSQDPPLTTQTKIKVGGHLLSPHSKHCYIFKLQNLLPLVRKVTWDVRAEACRLSLTMVGAQALPSEVSGRASGRTKCWVGSKKIERRRSKGRVSTYKFIAHSSSFIKETIMALGNWSFGADGY